MRLRWAEDCSPSFLRSPIQYRRFLARFSSSSNPQRYRISGSITDQSASGDLLVCHKQSFLSHWPCPHQLHDSRPATCRSGLTLS
ncbi:hypothetical protein Q9L58_007109 [Maublancomyces gigas]|uniref:Uncharacterized protein n=1 Tax=Discina gigas TaxID=1032678 RepID=A0ABR3GDR9_9PEZI